jgi:hypothetical protein
MNGLNIKDKETFSELYSKDPGLAMGLVFENVSSLKENVSAIKEKCDCRLESCKLQRKKDRAKNTAIQFGGGLVGGVATAWVFIKAYIATMIKSS